MKMKIKNLLGRRVPASVEIPVGEEHKYNTIREAIIAYRHKNIKSLTLLLDQAVYSFPGTFTDLPFALQIIGGPSTITAGVSIPPTYITRQDEVYSFKGETSGFFAKDPRNLKELSSQYPGMSNTLGWLEKNPLIQRREILTIEGISLLPVMSIEELIEGTFFVEDGSKTIYFKLPAEASSTPRDVKYSGAGQDHMKFGSCPEVVLKDISFTYSSHSYAKAAAMFSKIGELEIINCEFGFNSSKGLSIHGCKGVLLDEVSTFNNGLMGFGLSFIDEYKIEGLNANNNGWLAKASGTKIWAVGGGKIMNSSGKLISSVFMSNEGRGFWLDVGNYDTSLRLCTLAYNTLDGIFIEANQGPILISDSSFTRNAISGVRIGASERITIEGSYIAGNTFPIYVAYGTRKIVNRKTGEVHRLVISHLTLRGNEIPVDSTGRLVSFSKKISEKIKEYFLETSNLTKE